MAISCLWGVEQQIERLKGFENHGCPSWTPKVLKQSALDCTESWLIWTKMSRRAMQAEIETWMQYSRYIQLDSHSSTDCHLLGKLHSNCPAINYSLHLWNILQLWHNERSHWGQCIYESIPKGEDSWTGLCLAEKWRSAWMGSNSSLFCSHVEPKKFRSAVVLHQIHPNDGFHLPTRDDANNPTPTQPLFSAEKHRKNK